jgi:group I intron endonuclease
MVGIYKITSPTGKIYIGQSWDLKQRESYYRNMQSVRQPKLHASFLKHGWIRHLFEIVHILPIDVDQTIINQYEALYLQQYRNLGCSMLNIREAGSNGRPAKKSIEKGLKTKAVNGSAKRSNITKQKISLANSGKRKPLRSEQHRLNLSKANKGKAGHKQSDVTKQKRLETRKCRGSNQKQIIHLGSGATYTSRKEAAAAFGWTAENINHYIKKGEFKYISSTL